jgi:hypothetical protein
MVRGIINAGDAIGWGYIAWVVYSGAELSVSKDALLITTSILLAIDCLLLSIKYIGENF